MKITNKYNLPEPIYRAVSQVWPPRNDRLSVSNLINPPLMLYLTKRYWDDLEEDASDRLWALLGQGLHYVLAKYTQGAYLAEEKLQVEVYGTVISGRPDLYYAKTIEDYKVVSVFSFKLGEKEDWQRQLNTYAFMYRHHGFEVERLRINAILRDFAASRRYTDKTYPEIPFQITEISCWAPSTAAEYVAGRVRLFQKMPEAPCSDEARWFRPGKFAVKKQGNKRAMYNGLKDTMAEAQAFLEEQQAKDKKLKLVIEERPGVNMRCRDFCPVRNFCPINPEKGRDADGEDAEVENA